MPALTAAAAAAALAGAILSTCEAEAGKYRAAGCVQRESLSASVRRLRGALSGVLESVAARRVRIVSLRVFAVRRRRVVTPVSHERRSGVFRALLDAARHGKAAEADKLAQHGRRAATAMVQGAGGEVVHRRGSSPAALSHLPALTRAPQAVYSAIFATQSAPAPPAPSADARSEPLRCRTAWTARRRELRGTAAAAAPPRGPRPGSGARGGGDGLSPAGPAGHDSSVASRRDRVCGCAALAGVDVDRRRPKAARRQLEHIGRQPKKRVAAA